MLTSRVGDCLRSIETESARWSDYVWNDGKWLYNVYRETIDFGTVESVSIWYNNLPKGQEAECIIGPIKALPMVACTVKNPAVDSQRQGNNLAGGNAVGQLPGIRPGQ